MPSGLHYETYMRPDGPAVRLNYSLEVRTQVLEYDVRLETTQSSWGGIQGWFVCPLVGKGRSCGRRVQKLYLPPNARQFGCRHCYDLTYQSRRRGARGRAICKAFKIREGLGGNPCLEDEFPVRPPRMWRRKYERLRMEAEEAEKKFRC